MTPNSHNDFSQRQLRMARYVRESMWPLELPTYETTFVVFPEKRFATA